jgi:CheY-like chemotaxis protein
LRIVRALPLHIAFEDDLGNAEKSHLLRFLTYRTFVLRPMNVNVQHTPQAGIRAANGMAMTNFRLLFFWESGRDTSLLPWQLVCFVVVAALIYVIVLAVVIGRRHNGQSTSLEKPGAGKHVSSGIALPAAAHVTGNAAITVTGEGIRVLIMGEHTSHRAMLLRQVIALGHVKCTIASDGDQALEALRNADYDVIFADCTTPATEGTGLIQCIRRLEDLGARRTYIVALIPCTGDRQHHRCLRAGADEVFAKPVDTLQFADAIGHALTAMPVENPADPAWELALSDPNGWAMSMKLWKTLDDDMDRLRHGMETCDRELAAQASHRIAGAARWLQLARVAEAATQLEEDLFHPKCHDASFRALEEAVKAFSRR